MAATLVDLEYPSKSPEWVVHALTGLSLRQSSYSARASGITVTQG